METGAGRALRARSTYGRRMSGRTARFRDVFAVGEFRVLWIAQAQSRIGDQLARVALALLVFDRTDSPGLTALVYASTYLPPLLTAPLLAGLADRYPRRTVMVAVDLIRAALIALMAIPGLPLPVVAFLVLAATCPQPLFSAARTAALPTVLPGERFAVGSAVIASTDGIAQIVGFTLGGLIVSAGSPYLALALNAGTFVLSAALLRCGLRPHRPESDPSDAGRPKGGFALAGIAFVAADRRLMGLAALRWLYGLYVVPEVLAAPYAEQTGADQAAVGTLMAADVTGSVIGAVLVARLGPTLRRRLTVPLAVATGIPLMATGTGPNLQITFVMWLLVGLVSSYIVLAQVAFTQRVPDGMRGRAIGFASAGLQTAQGLGMLVGGVLAELVAPSVAIAVCAAAGSVGAIVIGAVFRLNRPARDGRERSAVLVRADREPSGS